MKHDDELYLDPVPYYALSEDEVARIRSEMADIQRRLGKPSGERPEPLTWAEEQNLRARYADLKEQLHRAQQRPVGPSATENESGEIAFNEEALGRALSNATPAERREFRAEVEKLGKAVHSLKDDLERAGLVGPATATNVGSGDDGFLDPVPYWK